jgi:hypothetical protein
MPTNLTDTALTSEGPRSARKCLLRMADELESLLNAWEEQILAGIEKRKTEVNPFGPLHSAATSQAAHEIIEQILGKKPLDAPAAKGA